MRRRKRHRLRRLWLLLAALASRSLPLRSFPYPSRRKACRFGLAYSPLRNAEHAENAEKTSKNSPHPLFSAFSAFWAFRLLDPFWAGVGVFVYRQGTKKAGRCPA